MGCGVLREAATAVHTFPRNFPIKGVRGASISLLKRRIRTGFILSQSLFDMAKAAMNIEDPRDRIHGVPCALADSQIALGGYL